MTRSSTASVAGAPSEWLLFEAFAIAEKFCPTDVLNLAHAELLPRISRAGPVPYVHVPSLPDWRMLLHIHGFKSLAEIADSEASEAADAII